MTQALQTLLEHAQRQRDEALAALQQAEAAEAQQRLQAEQLMAYQAEYDARHPARSGRAAPIELLRCHVGFMQRLHQARTQQQGQLQAAPQGSGWQLAFNDGKVDQVLDFAFDEVREARLVPVLDFKGRRGKGAPLAPEGQAGETVDGGLEK